jgi:hypothetical protein
MAASPSDQVVSRRQGGTSPIPNSESRPGRLRFNFDSRPSKGESFPSPMSGRGGYDIQGKSFCAT